MVGSEWIGTPPNVRPERYAEAAALLARATVPVELLVTGHCGLDGLADAFAAVLERRGLKTVLVRETHEPGLLLAADGRAVVVAIDHPLYTWPCPGLESREELIAEVVAAGADALIASYGTVRDCRAAFGTARAILKLDVTVLSVDELPPGGLGRRLRGRATPLRLAPTR